MVPRPPVFQIYDSLFAHSQEFLWLWGPTLQEEMEGNDQRVIEPRVLSMERWLSPHVYAISWGGKGVVRQEWDMIPCSGSQS